MLKNQLILSSLILSVVGLPTAWAVVPLSTVAQARIKTPGYRIASASTTVAQSSFELPGTTTLNAKEIEAPSLPQDLDAEVTDIKLRANSGAKSKFSSSVTLGYAGGSLRDPDSDIRPNVGKQKIPTPVNLSGYIGLRYRQNKNESFYFATGFARERPFHDREKGEQLELNTPSIVYNNTFKGKYDWQLSSSVRTYMTTLDRFRAIGEVAQAAYSLSALHMVGTSRFDLGATATVSTAAYNKHEERLRASQADYGVSLSPTLQYNKTGRVNFFTSLNLLSYTHYRAEPRALTFEKNLVMQTAGLGFAIMRDFYISPFVAFEPEDMSTKRTSANLSATINL